ncbi:DoxX family protein [Flammeovirga kamogawensis]|uniref:DoxX family membrane protein n=1 Tax=Flammeovirga kamogawensis TaxID=373891 RepID=A0ABX8H462_9BACT|nr:hypothetical protein [Flammeovirga kamogawensis]MBB6463529.1 putative membrane protein [Flammeovirga kamogawensis]QWG10586.1 hypothetical protein KM029_24700 [Flammeovirga kamogawensis]TRX63692.1 hypothetical protein EO216_25085 [Flammeovirga kamogawensis]
MNLISKLLVPNQISTAQKVAKTILGAALLYAGLGHLFWLRQEFVAQVPAWVPLEVDVVVVLSGFVEIALGLSLIFLSKYKAIVGGITALFFIAVFPGNISQYINQVDAFHLNTDNARFIRLLFQPLLVVWALWSTTAWEALKK